MLRDSDGLGGDSVSKQFSRFNPLNIIAIVIGLILVFANFKLLEANRALRSLQEAAKRERMLKEGAVVPALHGVRMDGEFVQYGFDTDPRSTLLFVLSARCRICDKNWINWKKIIATVREDEYRLLFANLDSEPLPDDYVKLHGLAELDVIELVDPQSRIDYRMGYTPQTILIDSGGRVQALWTGILTFPEERIQELQDKLGVSLAVPDE